MLAIKCTTNIFVISVYVSPLQQDICYVRVGVLKNCKEFLLSVTYSVFIGAGVRGLFIIVPHLLYINEVPTKHSREKNLDPRNTHRKKFWTHKTPTRK